MAYWLFKEEPYCYSFADLERDGSTIWSGVTNNLARKNLRQVSKGDRVLFYATGKVKSVVGEMEIVEGPRPGLDDEDLDRWWSPFDRYGGCSQRSPWRPSRPTLSWQIGNW